MLSPRPARDNENPRLPPWEVQLISLLLVAVEARDRRITRLEQFNRQLAVALDEQLGVGRERAA